ncbi:MAG: ABC transporter permease [Mycoplasmataceae bacterium]|nr:ABC transporter permease [Mycoplasmataceae bacterium]
MFKYILKRVSLAILTLIVLVTLVYFLVASFSKNPFSVNPETAVENAQKAGLYDPVLIRFGNYVSDIFNGTFGKIYVPKGGEATSIPEFFFLPLRWTLLITVPSLIFSSLIGISLGILAGYKRGTWIEAIINVFVVTFIGLPSFVIAPIMILIAVNSNGLILFDFKLPSDVGWLLSLKSLMLPILTVTLASLASYTILVRNQLVSILTSNQVLIAKGKGLSKTDIFLKHILRNISIPIITFMLPSFVILLAGNVIVEQFFNVPGSSNVIIQAFPSGEINIVMFSIIFYTTISLAIQIILDISYLFIDPRIIFLEKGKINYINNFVNMLKVKQNYKQAMKDKEDGIKSSSSTKDTKELFLEVENYISEVNND